jgi:hypothetical protein
MTLQRLPFSILYLICTFLIACSENKPDSLKEDIREMKKEQQDRLDHFRARFPGINEFESTDDPLTITLQEKVRNNSMFLLTGFKLSDVWRGDSTWVVRLKCAFRQKHILELTCDSTMAQRVIEVSTVGDSSLKRRSQLRGPSAIVARVKSVNRIKLYINSKGEQEGDAVHSRIELDTELPLRIAGELIDVQ